MLLNGRKLQELTHYSHALDVVGGRLRNEHRLCTSNRTLVLLPFRVATPIYLPAVLWYLL